MSLPIACAAACLLTACAGSTTPCAAPPSIPANLMADCPPLPTLGAGSFPEVAGHLALTGHLYNDCAARHKLLVRVLRHRDADNIKKKDD